MLRRIRMATVIALLTTPAIAADLALVIGNDDYRQLPSNPRGDDVVDAARALERQGVDVIRREDATLERMRQAFESFADRAPEASSLLVVLSGHFVSTSTDAYLLPVDANEPSLATLAARSLPVSVVLAVLEDRPGRSVLVLAHEPLDRTFDTYLRADLDVPDVPQGVTMVRAEPRPAGRLVEEVLAEPGRSLLQGARQIEGVDVSGFLSERYAFLSRGRAPEQRPIALVEDAWTEAREADTIAAYEDFLDRFPNSANSADARRRIDALRSDPQRQAQLDERALGLTEPERREIQRQLDTLGHYGRAIDGIFGEGTRSAVRQWQRQEGYDQTGYLTAAQLVRLEEASAQRTAATEREDRAFWRESAETAEGYRRYLDRYPDGLYAEMARSRLAAIDDDARRQNIAADRRGWDAASAEDTRAAYREYLEEFPDGAFASEARAAIGEADADAAQRQEALATERALGVNALTARLIEERLEALGLNPGPVDGSLDDQTRNALERYQGENGLPSTGYLTQPTVAQLLADSVRQLFE